MFLANRTTTTPPVEPFCEDYDLGGPNCPVFTGPIAVYRFSFAMVLFFFIFMIITLGVSTSNSFRAHLHNGLVIFHWILKFSIIKWLIFTRFWLWKFLFAAFLVSLSFKLPFFGGIKTGIYSLNVSIHFVKFPYMFFFQIIAWMYIGMVAGSVYILINLLLLIELSYSWTEKM